MIYKETFKIGLKDIGKDDKIKNRAIIEFLEDLGARHSDLAGYGVNDREKTKISWILLEWKLKITDRPKYGDELEIHTWGRDANRVFTYRDFEIYNQEGKLCAIATSKWAIVNIETGKLAKLTEEMIASYKMEDNKKVFEEELKKIKIPEESKETLEYTVVRRDIDLNKHMHNLYYLDLAYEALPEEIYKDRPFDKLQITYKREIKLGAKVKCNFAKKENKNIIIIKSEDNKTLHAAIELW